MSRWQSALSGCLAVKEKKEIRRRYDFKHSDYVFRGKNHEAEEIRKRQVITESGHGGQERDGV